MGYNNLLTLPLQETMTYEAIGQAVRCAEGEEGNGRYARFPGRVFDAVACLGGAGTCPAK